MGDLYGQTDYGVRFDWGPVGAEAISAGAEVAVVVDVLSFTTTVSVAVEMGVEVYPFPWRDERAAQFAADHDAVLAVGRLEAAQADRPDAVSLSPASLRAAPGLRRIVVPSPNGSTISEQLSQHGCTIVAACLRNRRAVAAWIVDRLDRNGRSGRKVAVVAAGERWSRDDSLRPAVEDLWGAGSLIAALRDGGLDALSPESAAAEAAFRAARQHGLVENLQHCVSGRELAVRGFSADAAIAAELDASSVVPVLAHGRFEDVHTA